MLLWEHHATTSWNSTTLGLWWLTPDYYSLLNIFWVSGFIEVVSDTTSQRKVTRKGYLSN
jgi:uncharacterized membrane protein YkvI